MKLTAILIFLFSNAIGLYGQYYEGYYYTKDNKKVEGFLKHKFGARFSDEADNSILFKKDKSSKKIRLTIDDMRSFVLSNVPMRPTATQKPLKKDSFAIVENFTIGAFAVYRQDFAQVITSGKLTLYTHYTTSGSGQYQTTSINYLLKRNGRVNALKKKYFKENYAEIFEGHTEMIDKIARKELDFDNIVTMVEEYNEWYRTNGKK